MRFVVIFLSCSDFRGTQIPFTVRFPVPHVNFFQNLSNKHRTCMSDICYLFWGKYAILWLVGREPVAWSDRKKPWPGSCSTLKRVSILSQPARSHLEKEYTRNPNRSSVFCTRGNYRGREFLMSRTVLDKELQELDEQI